MISKRLLFLPLRFLPLRFLPHSLAALLIAAVLSLTLTPSTPLQAEEGLREAPTALQRNIAREISVIMEYHLSRQEFDDRISVRGFRNFLDSLDPLKVYFLASDVAEFESYQNSLDDLTKSGDLDFAFQVFRRFLTRVEQRIALVEELVELEHDFSVNESLVIDPDYTSFAASDKEVRDVWRRRVKYDLLVEKATALEDEEVTEESSEKKKDTDAAEKPEAPKEESAEENTDSLAEAKETILKRYRNFSRRMSQIDNWELLEMYISALTSGFDPHTTYFSPKSLENFEISMRLELDGIGAALTSEDGYTVVTQVIPGGAADRDGRLKRDDKIVAVGQGEEGEMEDVVGMKLNDVVPKIRGKRDSIVRLEVLPEGETKRKIYKLTRARVELADSAAQSRIIDEPEGGVAQAGPIGIIDLPSFYRDMSAAEEGKEGFRSTTADVRKILAEFREKKVKAVLIDLRRNGGGSLTEAIELTGLFIDRGPVVQVKDLGQKHTYQDTDRGVAWDGPLVVLTSKLSASASEIFAGAIQDYQRGIIVGDPTTHGKGTVQRLLDIARGAGGALKLTTQQFYRPNGDSTQHRGVMANIVLPSMTSEWDVGEADLDYSLPFDQVPAVDVHDYGMFDGELITKLSALSDERRRNSEDFKRLHRNIERYQRIRDRVQVSLNEEKYLAERKALADGEEDEEEEPDEEDTIPMTYYLKEALAITTDYLRLGPWQGDQSL